MRFGLVILVAVGCADPVPVPTAQIVVDVTLRAGDLDGVDAPSLMGVALDPDGGRVLLDAWGGLFDVTEEGVATLRADPVALTTIERLDLRPYTDVVALEPGAFAVTVTGDGLRYDEATGETQQHFCYEPGFMEPSAAEYTEAVAFDPGRGLIYAQPQTTVDGQVTASSVGAYDVTGGQPIQWFETGEREFLAGGMAVDGDALLLASGVTLFRGPIEDVHSPYVDLGEWVEDDVRGLSIDPDSDRLVLVTADRWIELAGWRP